MELSENTIHYLSSLEYRPDAKRRVNLLPFSGFFWEDEHPYDPKGMIQFSQLGDSVQKEGASPFWNPAFYLEE
jgi:hypothetical protein